MISVVKRIFTTPFPHRFSPYRSVASMKVLNVAEKNDAAKTLAGFMSSNIKRREGFSKYNKIYEFESVLFGQKCDMIMTSVSGHLLGLEFLSSYRGWRSCNPLALFDAPVTKQCLQGYEDIKRTLEREMRRCSVLIIWTDCDREGENIGFEIIEVCTAVKQNIKIYRAKFSEITSQSVKRALQNLSQPDKRTNDAVEVRQELDLRIGAAFTRFQTLRLRNVFPQTLSDSLISYGSCQFPTLGFVVERYKAIQNFIPESFWKIKVIHEKNDLCVDFSWKRVRLFDELTCQCFYEMCLENPVATVLSVNSKPKSRWRPLPLDTVELEKVGSRKLRLNAKEIMRIAEKLYTQGFISYPRTETNIFPKEINLANLIGMQTADPAWGEFASRIVQDGPNPRNGTKSDKAHPPIHPIKYTSNLSGNEQKIYEFVVRRFLACCSKDAEGYETIVEINIADELFVASGLMIKAKNFLEVYPYEKWTAKEIHVYQVGETFKPVIEMVDGVTSAPRPLTEADLIALMEKHGIGTDATHADHIETIKSRSYVGLENDRFFVPGHLGMGLVEGYDSMGFPMSKPNLRAELEADLIKICEGRRNPEIVLKEQLQRYKQVFEIALQQAARIDEALAIYLEEEPCQTENVEINTEIPCVIYKCPACGYDMVLRTKRDGNGKFISCTNYPVCKNAVWFPIIVENVEVSDEICSQCTPQFKKLKFKFRGPVGLYLREDILCIGGCDTDLLEVLNIRITSVRQNTNATSGDMSSGSFNINRNAVNNTGQSTRFMGSSTTSFSNSSGNTSTFSSISSSTNRNTGNTRGRGRSRREAGQRTITDIFQRSVETIERNGSIETGSTNVENDELNLDNDVKCDCNQNALLLTTRKEGPNKGRQFYKCGNDSQCRFFQWADSTSSLTLPQNSSDWNARQSDNNSFIGSSTMNPGSSSSGQFAIHSNINTPHTIGNPTNAVVCACNENAVLLTVRKDGPNKGRQFYKCGNRQGSGCNFFLWADSSDNNGYQNQQPPPPPPPPPSQRPGPVPGSSWQYDGNGSTADTDSEDVRCRCGGPARRLVVQKDNENKGRPFYVCPKVIEKCNFFLWADEGSSRNSGTSSNSNWRGNNQGGAGSNLPSDGRKKRKCGNCHVEGHTKRNCPNK